MSYSLAKGHREEGNADSSRVLISYLTTFDRKTYEQKSDRATDCLTTDLQ